MGELKGGIGGRFSDFLDEQGVQAEMEAAALRALALTSPERREHTACMGPVTVKVAYDVDAKVWYVESSDLPGLNVEAPTVERLQEQLSLAVADLIEAAGEEGYFDIPIEIIAHLSLRARRHAA